MFREITDYKQELIDSFLSRSCQNCGESSCMDIICRLNEIKKIISIGLKNDNKDDYYNALEQIDFICDRLLLLGER